jgi:hypothetical protein
VRRNIIKQSVTAVLVMFVQFGFGQVSFENVDQRIIDLYGESRVNEMIVNQPNLIDYLNYYVNNAYKIIYDVPERKLGQFEDISSITNTRTGLAIAENDLDNLNILLLSITRSQNEYLTYRIGSTGNVIVFIAPQFLLDEYNNLSKIGEGKQ